ncbi:A-kinase anchor protein 6 [Dissostichus eleginoides]|uniref:A-kinase anchor protein 6 n=1 Tax=Dissostichus eleginoides TaxID=100907 RepID=A0AAD9C476_DISEL|nr:A-kinase anchor protein 6 [Dissostichus eleginoides]
MADLIPGQCEALAEQMAVRLSSLQYPPSASRRNYSQLTRNNSCSEISSVEVSGFGSVVKMKEFEAEYQELWDWLMDMDAMVTDSHQLMMSEEQRHHLFKGDPSWTVSKIKEKNGKSPDSMAGRRYIMGSLNSSRLPSSSNPEPWL